MTRKIAFALSALVLAFATRRDRRARRPDASAADPGVTSTSILLGSDVAALRGRLRLRLRGARRGCVLQVRQRPRRGERPQDPLQVRRRRVQPGADGAGDAPARRAGQGLRRLQRARHRAEPRDARLPERAEGAAAVRGVGRDGVGSEAAKYPYTIGLQPSYQAEGWVLGKYLAPHPGRREGGSALPERRLRQGPPERPQARASSGRRCGSSLRSRTRSRRATSRSQVAKLRSSGANVFAVFATPKFAIQAYVYANKLGWKPKLTLTNAVSSASNVMQLASEGGTNKVVEGSVSIVVPQGPDRPELEERRCDEALPLDHEALCAGRERQRRLPRLRHGGRVDAVEALRRAGKDLTRDGPREGRCRA